LADLAFIAVIVVFFALATLFVRACDRIIGADEEPEGPGARTPAEPTEVAA
jgi:hypothetical protein